MSREPEITEDDYEKMITIAEQRLPDKLIKNQSRTMQSETKCDYPPMKPDNYYMLSHDTEQKDFLPVSN